ncbi:MAG TPA: hypothetical protein VFC96_03220 [Anaerovoracaceae bacterium]|nr:hypothetical protein [Anaerovoracaceae bacterium]
MFEIPNGDDVRSRYLTYEQMNLINAFRRISMNAAIFGRLMLDCMIRDSPCFEAAYSRLLQVSYDTFRIFSNYYSEDDSEKLYGLMMQDYILMKRLVESLVAKDEQAAADTMQLWRENISKIADQYAMMNPYWTKEQWETLLSRNLQLVYQQILALFADDCPRAFNIFDRIKSLSILIGDYQARGIMQNLVPPSINSNPNLESHWHIN